MIVHCAMRSMALLLLLSSCLSSCASGLHEARKPAARRSSRTVVLFLVDGLGAKILQKAMQQNRMPHTKRFFLRQGSGFALAQASFPTLTYPNIASILTARPVGEQPVLGNQVMLSNGKMRSYEDAKNHDALRALIDPQTVIGRLQEQGRESASFSYIFGMNADSHMSVGIQEGLEYKRHDYMSLDERLLTNLENFLDRNSSEWPDFIYVHLIGVDAIAHAFGSTSRETMDYLRWLDGRLSPVLGSLARGERHRKVITMMTADHGFVDTKHYLSLKKKMLQADLDLEVTNESRFLALHLSERRNPLELGKALRIAREHKEVAFTVWRRGDELEIESAAEKFRFVIGPAACGQPISLASQAGIFQCATDFDEGGGEYPFLVSQLARYFSAPYHPDALVVAMPGVSFTRGSKASHGGPTADETLVPLLLRNASITGTVRTSDLLKILDQPLPNIENMNAKPTARQAKAQ